ncbi:hypothetical protein MKX01_028236 [Papaver californicum]|nr:hypothetical protein MKX01_028236 [Papaver californicum]
MATKISPVFLTALFFFAIVNMSDKVHAKWNISKISSLSEITGAEMCRSGDTYDSVDCGPTRECKCCNECVAALHPVKICKPGDIHDVFLCGPTRECKCCIDSCEDKCRGMGSSVASQKCTKFINSEGYPTTTCDCCCKGFATTTTSTLKLYSGDGSSSITG